MLEVAQMNKKSIIYLVVIIILLVIVFALFDKCSKTIFKEYDIKNESISTTKNKEIFEYNLDEKPINYKVDTKKGREEYFEYLKQYIKPIRLLNFINDNDIDSLKYNTNGNEMIKWLIKVAYINMISSMFDITRTDYDDCAVTKHFLEKFDKNLTDYFEIGGEDNWVDVYTTDKIIKVTKRWHILLDGEAEFSWLYVFKYTLDEEGNVDDIIFDYDTGDF